MCSDFADVAMYGTEPQELPAALRYRKFKIDVATECRHFGLPDNVCTVL